MASEFLSSSTTLLLALNLLFLSLPSCSTYSPAPPKPTTLTTVQQSKPTTLTSPHPAPTKYPVPKILPTPKYPPPPNCPTPPSLKPPAKSPTVATCSRDALKLGVCGNVLGGLLGVVHGTPDKKPCCALLEGLSDLEAAVCLCTAIKAKVLGLNLNVPVDLSLLLNYCGNKAPSGLICA